MTGRGGSSGRPAPFARHDEGAFVKFCPSCGTGVEAGAGSCESCGADLVAVWASTGQSPLPTATASSYAGGEPATVADLTPRQLRREIRWGVFQGILLVGAISLVVYLVVVLLVAGVITTTISGGN